MSDELWSSSTVGITKGASLGLLQSLGLAPDSGIPGAGIVRQPALPVLLLRAIPRPAASTPE